MSTANKAATGAATSRKLPPPWQRQPKCCSASATGTTSCLGGKRASTSSSRPGASGATPFSWSLRQKLIRRMPLKGLSSSMSSLSPWTPSPFEKSLRLTSFLKKKYRLVRSKTRTSAAVAVAVGGAVACAAVMESNADQAEQEYLLKQRQLRQSSGKSALSTMGMGGYGSAMFSTIVPATTTPTTATQSASTASSTSETESLPGQNNWQGLSPPCSFELPPTLPREYDWERIDQYWSARPVSVISRLGQMVTGLVPIVTHYVKNFVLYPIEDEDDQDGRDALLHEFAVKLRETLTRLGPAFIKAGQQLSIRPDITPKPVMDELQKLCDSVPPVPDDIAMRVLREELFSCNSKVNNMPSTDTGGGSHCDDAIDEEAAMKMIEETFQDIRLVASASLGQVYKAKIKTKRDTGKDKHGDQQQYEEVAIKVQRPNIQRAFSLDLFLLQRIGAFLDFFTDLITNQKPFHTILHGSFARGSYGELDYEHEASNQIHFQNELSRRNCPIVVPRVYGEYTTQRVLTTEWIDGVKLSEADPKQIQRLISVGIELFLMQLLDIGTFHADPHPGNLLVTTGPDGTQKLCLIDYGLCTSIDDKSRQIVTKAIQHLLLRDYESLISRDAKDLGFLPNDYDVTEVKPILIKILSVGVVDNGSGQTRKRRLQEISHELSEVFFKFPFIVPPFFSLVTRGLGLLEGIALTGDRDFDIFRATAPYVKRRAMNMILATSSKPSSP